MTGTPLIDAMRGAYDRAIDNGWQPAQMAYRMTDRTLERLRQERDSLSGQHRTVGDLPPSFMGVIIETDGVQAQRFTDICIARDFDLIGR